MPTLTPRTLTALPLNEAETSPGDAQLIEWTTAEAYQPSGTITRDANEVITVMNVLWPDGSAGAFTTTATHSGSGAINAYTITHADSGKTITQSAMTRDSGGAVTVKPALTVA